MRNVLFEHPFESIFKLVAIVIPVIMWLVYFSTDRAVNLSFTMMISGFLTLCTNFLTIKTRFYQRGIISVVSKILIILSIFLLATSLGFDIYQSSLDFYQLTKAVDAVNQEILSQQTTNQPIVIQQIVLSDIFQCNDYILPFVLYLFSFISFLWDAIISAIAFVAKKDNTSNNIMFDVTKLDTN